MIHPVIQQRPDCFLCGFSFVVLYYQVALLHNYSVFFPKALRSKAFSIKLSN